MEFYKTIKKIASKTPKLVAIGIIGALPYACESCGFSSSIATAKEMRQEVGNEISQQTSKLELFIKK